MVEQKYGVGFNPAAVRTAAGKDKNGALYLEITCKDQRNECIARETAPNKMNANWTSDRLGSFRLHMCVEEKAARLGRAIEYFAKFYKPTAVPVF